jgi:arylsulfatase A-like enzyme
MKSPSNWIHPLPIALLCVLFCLVSGFAAKNVAGQTAKPNIVLINLDDADTELFSEFNLQRYPNLKQLSDRALKFTNLHATTPLCGPSRACLYRGQYAHNTGILVNEPNHVAANGMPGGLRNYRDQGFFSNDLSTWMKDAGYHTMMVGKFMHGDFIPIIPPGWDDFYSYMGSRYYEFYTLTNEEPQGKWSRAAPGEYRTMAETKDAIKALDEHANRDDGQPFFLCLNPLGPHSHSAGPSMVEERYRNYWKLAVAPRPLNYDEPDLSDKRGEFANLTKISPGWKNYIGNHYRDRLRATLSLDDQLGAIVQKLEEIERLENTYIIVTSDNGYSLGENRVFGKGYHYDHGSKVPLLVAGPDIQPAVANHLLGHIDLAPTIVDIAGGSVPDEIDGVSFRQLLESPESVAPHHWRESILIENWESKIIFGKSVCAATNAMRRYDSVYVEHPNGEREYYDLASDPHQLENIYDSMSIVGKSTLELQLRSLKTDRNPRVGVSHPFENGVMHQGGLQINGIADAPQGVSAVRVALQDQVTGKFWDGSQWVDGFRQVGANVENQFGIITKWSLGFEPDEENLPEGLVFAWVWSYDSMGRFSNSFYRSFRIEAGLPASKIITPVVKSAMTGTVKCEGTAFSTGQAKLVRFVLRRASDGQFWNGNDFQAPWTFVELPIAQDGGWQQSVDLAPGDYFAVSYTVDKADGYQRKPTIHFFTVE